MASLQPQKPQKMRLIIPFILLLILTAGTVGFYLLQTTRLLDEQEINQTFKLAEAALEAELNDLGDWAYDYGYWNNSVENLTEQLNQKWADDNVGRYLFESHGISASLVFDANNKLLASFVAGRQVDDTSPFNHLQLQIQPLLDQARELSFLGPKAANGVIRVGQDNYLIAAQAIIPENAPVPFEKHRGVLVLLKIIDKAMIWQMSQSYLLHNLKLVASRPQAPQASLALNSITGEQLGFLQWQPDQPGQKIFRTLAPAIPIPLALTLILTLIFLHRMQLIFRERVALHRQIEEEKIRLEESEGALRAIIEAIPSPLFYKTAKGFYLGCNQAFCDYIGLPIDKIIGHNVQDVAPSDLAAKYHQADLDLMQQGGTQTYEAQVRYANGNLRDILFNKATIDNPDGTAIGLVGIMTDISEIKEAQHESRRLRNLLRNIIDSMPSLLITVDEDQRITEWNRWAAIASRVPADQALGRPLFEVFPALAERHADITTALVSGKVQTLPGIPWKLHDREIIVDLTVYPLDKNKGSGAVLRADDTTDRVRIEEVMVLSEKMLSIGSLAAGMAHEINNPLAIILQHAQVLQNRLNPELGKNAAVAKDCQIDLDNLSNYLQQRGISEMLDAIRSAGDRAKVIVEEMVNFAQHHKAKYTPCNLPKLIEETLHLAETDYDLKKKFNYRNIVIHKEIAADIPQLTCDRHEIQQVLLNLLRNSARAMHEATISNPQIRISILHDDQNIQIKLADNGPGINPAAMNQIFDPFFTTGKVGEGTGLGLSVAYFIICEKHGGNMRAENLNEGGCRFTIDLPLESLKDSKKENLPQTSVSTA